MDPELYKEMYKFEWEQRSHMTSAVNIPIVAITALGSVLGTIVLGYPYECQQETSVFSIVVLLTALFIGGSILFVILSLINAEYAKLPSALKLRQYYIKLCAWHEKHGSNIESAEKEFQEKFDLQLAQAAEANGEKNRIRGNCIYLATVCLILSLIPLGIAAVCYVDAKINAPDKIHSVRIVK